MIVKYEKCDRCGKIIEDHEICSKFTKPRPRKYKIFKRTYYYLDATSFDFTVCKKCADEFYEFMKGGK